MKHTKSSGKSRSCLGRALGIDLHRSLCAPSFFLTTGLLLAWMLVNSARKLSSGYWSGWGLAGLLDKATTSLLDMAPLLLPIATVAYSGSYLMDRESSFWEQAVQRVGVRAYGCARVLSAALSPFLAVGAAILIYTLVGLAWGIPATGSQPMPPMGYLMLAEGGHFLPYLLARIVVTGLSCALASVFALTVSAFLRNTYVTLLAPLIAYYLIMILCGMLLCPNVLNLTNLLFLQPFENALFSLVWTTVYLLTLTVLCGQLFLWKLRKEWEA